MPDDGGLGGGEDCLADVEATGVSLGQTLVQKPEQLLLVAGVGPRVGTQVTRPKGLESAVSHNFVIF